jgi:hypothetical protein
VVSSLLSDPIPDGGEWNMFVNVIKKYGVIPKTFMPETANSNNSDPMNTLFASKLREYAKVLRDTNGKGASPDELRERKGELMEEELFDRLSIRPLTIGDLDAIVDIDHKILGKSRRDYWRKRLNFQIRNTLYPVWALNWMGR